MFDGQSCAALVIVVDEPSMRALGPQLHRLKRFEAKASKFS
jgi:hypothetical protein